jgi:acyl-CoA thioesterase FadM
MMSLGNTIGGPSRAQAMIKGQGLSLILKSVEVQFRRPVTYPDTVRV